MNNPDHISESLETIFLVKMLKFFYADPGWKKFGSGIRDKHPGSATLTNIFDDKSSSESEVKARYEFTILDSNKLRQNRVKSQFTQFKVSHSFTCNYDIY
jgi:hypothetical protein